MANNPFLSKNFTSIWSSFFLNGKKTFAFSFLPELLFFKKWVYYINVGRNITNGMCYKISEETKHLIGAKVLLIYDVPTFFKIASPKFLGLKKIRQYSGFLCDLSAYESFDIFLQSQFKSNSRYKFKRNLERLELSFNINYAIHFGNIDKEMYNEIMRSFKGLIEKRFTELKKYNDVVATWDYYTALIYPMILEKKALLQTISKDGEYIGVSLSFMNNNIMHFAITSFDTDYKRYNLGHTNIIKLIEWCFDNNINIFDFSKGENEYKLRWTDTEYVYENHIVYNKKNSVSICIANSLAQYFKLKQFLRDKQINILVSKFRYSLQSIVSTNKKSSHFTLTEIKDPKNLKITDYQHVSDEEYDKLKPIIYDRLYKFPEPELNLKVYKNERNYLVIGKRDSYTVSL